MKVDLRQYLLKRFPKAEDHGDEIGVPCPTCDDGRTRDFRLWVNIKKNIGYCYKCKESFPPLELVQRLEDCTFQEAIKILANHAIGMRRVSMEQLLKRVEQAFSEPDEREAPEVKLPVAKLPFGFKLCADYRPKKWPSYIMKRIGAEKLVYAHRIGWCDTGYFEGRMVVPVYQGGELRSFIARDMTGKAERKVLYPKGSPTSKLLYGYDEARFEPHVVLVEGVFDKIRLGKKSMAIFGTTMSRHQLSLLFASDVEEVTLMLDSDPAGRDGVVKLRKVLRERYPVRVVWLPQGRDPDEYERAALWERIERTPRVGRGDLAAHVRALLGE